MLLSGLKTYVPLTRSNILSDVPPPDWANQIMQRVYDEIDQTNPRRPLLRAYIRTVSSGLADLHGVPPQKHCRDGSGWNRRCVTGQGGRLRAEIRRNTQA
jgi:hypothetical protein